MLKCTSNVSFKSSEQSSSSFLTDKEHHPLPSSTACHGGAVTSLINGTRLPRTSRIRMQFSVSWDTWNFARKRPKGDTQEDEGMSEATDRKSGRRRHSWCFSHETLREIPVKFSVLNNMMFMSFLFWHLEIKTVHCERDIHFGHEGGQFVTCSFLPRIWERQEFGQTWQSDADFMSCSSRRGMRFLFQTNDAPLLLNSCEAMA